MACEEEERQRGGEFRSLFDLVQRTQLRREAIENLIMCGAFDSYGLERRELVWQLGLFYRSGGGTPSSGSSPFLCPQNMRFVTEVVRA